MKMPIAFEKFFSPGSKKTEVPLTVAELSKILFRERNNEEYRGLIEGLESDQRGWEYSFRPGGGLSTNFADFWKKEYLNYFNKETLGEIGRRIKNSIVCDLGAGGGFIFDYLIENMKPRAFVAVDKFNYEGEPGVLRKFLGENDYRIKIDMLDFLSKLKDGSSNFVINGIDKCVICNPSYHEAVALEMIRCLKPGGVILGSDSYSLTRIADMILLKDARVKDLTCSHEDNGKTVIFKN